VDPAGRAARWDPSLRWGRHVDPGLGTGRRPPGGAAGAGARDGQHVPPALALGSVRL